MKLINPVGREATKLGTEANYETRNGCTCSWWFMSDYQTDSGCGCFCIGDDDQLVNYLNSALA